MTIKSYILNNQKTAQLCSEQATYKLKRSETSNTFLICGLQSGQILKQTSVTVDMEKTKTNKYQVFEYLSENFQMFTEDGELRQVKATKQDVLRECQISD